MDHASWKEKYSLKHQVIDTEHKHLFEIAEEAFKPVAPEKRKLKIKTIITELHKYMNLHFYHEESYMRVIEYPNIGEHQVKHHTIIENMETLLHQLQTLNIKEFEKTLAAFIETALVHHILEEDTKILEWYKTKKGQKYIVRWKKEYLLNNEQIDKEHKELFKIANDAFLESESPTSKQDVRDTISKLSSYFSSHFKHEEEYMKSVSYPAINYHKLLHEKIIEEINIFLKKIPTMETAVFEFELAVFIEKWLVQHIIYEDKKIREFVDGYDIDIIDLTNLTAQ